MTDIRPDTSLYTELSDRLLAFSMILVEDSKGGQMQALIDETWEAVGPHRNLPGMAQNCISGRDYRIKPKPRELWAVYNSHGSQVQAGVEVDPTNAASSWDRADPNASPHTIVRFVEQP